MGSSLLDESITWADFGKKHLDRRLTKALTDNLGLQRPTLVQSRGIPVALEGKDLLCRARTGSGKTLCYAVPMVQLLLKQAESKSSSTPVSGLILVPTKELIAQVQGVVNSLLAFCFDVLSVDALLTGEKYLKAELPTALVTTPSSLLALVKQRQAKGSMRPLAETLKVLVIDEADLMFSFGYEEDVRALCALMPPKYQAMLFSATLSEEVQQLKGLMLHKPVVLKLEEPRVTGKLSQFYFVCHKTDKYLILYTLLKLQLISGKTLIFVKNIESAYRLKILLERFSMNSAVLNGELPHASRQNIIQSFNEGLVELLIATDDGLGGEMAEEDDEEDDFDGDEEGEEEEELEEDEEVEAEEEAVEEPVKAKLSKKQQKAEEEKKKKAAEEEKVEAEGQKKASKGGKDVADNRATKRRKLEEEKAKAAKAEEEEEEDEEGQEEGEEEEEAEDDEVVEDVKTVAKSANKGQPTRERFGGRRRREADVQYSITRGVDLQGVSTVLNADVPMTVRDYVHRVGRCARGGASGTALTICTDEEEPMLQKIMRAQKSSGGTGEIKPLPMQISDAERFRYRVEDMSRGLTKKVIGQYRARELQLEALNSEKLKAYFDEHPDDKRALQRTQRQLRERKSVRQHLKSVPTYLVPENFTSATPVQQAVRDDAMAKGTVAPVSAAVKRRRAMQARKQDPLEGFAAGPKSNKRRDRFTRDAMLAKERRINPATANVEALPFLSGKKLWKLRHGKRVRKATDVMGERKRLNFGERLRQKKFGKGRTNFSGL